MKQIEWTEAALEDLAALDKAIARRVQKALEGFATTGAGNIKKLKGINPPEFRLRAGDYRVRFELGTETTIRVLRVRNRPRSVPLNGYVFPSQSTVHPV